MGTLPPAQAPFGQLHLGQGMVAEYPHSGDGGQWSVSMWELEDLVFLGIDVEVFCVCAHLHLRGRESRGDPGPQPQRSDYLAKHSMVYLTLSSQVGTPLFSKTGRLAAREKPPSEQIGKLRKGRSPRPSREAIAPTHINIHHSPLLHWPWVPHPHLSFLPQAPSPQRDLPGSAGKRWTPPPVPSILPGRRCPPLWRWKIGV